MEKLAIQLLVLLKKLFQIMPCLHKADMAKMILPSRHFLIATAGGYPMREMRMILVYATF